MQCVEYFVSRGSSYLNDSFAFPQGRLSPTPNYAPTSADWLPTGNSVYSLHSIVNAYILLLTRPAGWPDPIRGLVLIRSYSLSSPHSHPFFLQFFSFSFPPAEKYLLETNMESEDRCLSSPVGAGTQTHTLVPPVLYVISLLTMHNNIML